MNVGIHNYKTINKGALKASFTLEVQPEGMRVLNCRYFSQDGKRWFKFPFIVKEGSTDRIPYISYRNKDYLKKLTDAVLEALNEQEDSQPVSNKVTTDSAPQTDWYSDL